MIRRSSVVLPAPLRPTTATMPPRCSWQEMPRSTEMPAMVVETFSSVSMRAAHSPITFLMTSGSRSTSSGAPSAAILPAIQAASRVA